LVLAGAFGPATTHRDTPIEAIRFAIEMLGKGFDDVVIVDVDRDGKAYTPAEFLRVLQAHPEIVRAHSADALETPRLGRGHGRPFVDSRSYVSLNYGVVRICPKLILPTVAPTGF
jgi:hypothetical protein